MSVSAFREMVSAGDGDVLRQVDWSGRPEVRAVPAHEHKIEALLFLGGGVFASGSSSGEIKLWSPEGGCLQTFRAHQEGVRRLAGRDDGTLVSMSNNEVKVWDRNGTCLQTLNGDAAPRPHERGFLLKNDRLAHLNRMPDVHYVSNHCFDFLEMQDGTHVISMRTGEILLRNPDGNLLATLEGYTRNPTLYELTDGTLVSAGDQGEIIEWSMGDFAPCFFEDQHSDSINSLVDLNQGRFASGSSDATVKIWDRATGACLRTLPHAEKVVGLLKLRNGPLVSLMEDEEDTTSTLKFWNEEGHCLQTLAAEDEEIGEIFQTEEGTLAGRVTNWNLKGQLGFGSVKFWEFTQNMRKS